MRAANDEREQTLNQILTEMDGFDARTGVVVLAATNRPDILDPALLRPGASTGGSLVNPPDRTAGAAILRVHTRNVPLADDPWTLTQVAAQTPGMVGADLRNLVNEAALTAARHRHERVELARLHRGPVADHPRRGAADRRSRRRSVNAPHTTRPVTRSWEWSSPAPTRCARSRSSRVAGRSA